MAQTAPTAADMMTAAPRTCSTFSSVLEAVLIFRDADCGAVPILEDGKPVGVLTDRDVALALADHPDIVAQPVTVAMSREVFSVKPDATVGEVAEQIAYKSVRRLLVIDSGGQLRGIISWADIAPYLTKAQVGAVVSEVVEQDPAAS